MSRHFSHSAPEKTNGRRVVPTFVSPRLEPTARHERIELLDALRGFALLGIMFVNLTWFTGFAVLSEDQRAALATARLDGAVAWLIHLLVDSKFWSLFALLFGIGAAIQAQRAESRGQEYLQLFLRRNVVLFGIGMLHAIFLWFGDIVSLYAVAALGLLLFRRVSQRGLIAWALILLALPVVQGAVWLAAYNSTASNVPVADPGHGPAELLRFFGEGSYRQAFAANWTFLKERWVLAIYDGRFFKLLGMFLLGIYVVKNRWLQRPEDHRTLLRRVLVWGLLIGLPTGALAATLAESVPHRPPTAMSLFLGSIRCVEVPALCVAYAAGFALLFVRWPADRGLGVFRYTGRLSLTNYIGQSAIAVVIFYGYGLGLWGRIGVTWTPLIILLLFLAQTVFSIWWLRRFRFGPLEWIWRCLTYGELLPLR